MNGSQQTTGNKKNILNKLRQIKRFRPETAFRDHSWGLVCRGC